MAGHDGFTAGMVGARAAPQRVSHRRAGPADVDVAELYDPFSFEIIRQMEAFGFCAEGEGGPFVEEGNIGPGGAIPVTTDGGTMSFSHAGINAQQLQRVIRAVQQLRGECADRPGPGGRGRHVHQRRLGGAVHRRHAAGCVAAVTDDCGRSLTGIPLPQPTRLSAPYWDAARQGSLVYQRCASCDALPPLPVAMCGRCNGRVLIWETSSGRGTLYSWTVVWRPQHPSFQTPTRRRSWPWTKAGG